MLQPGVENVKIRIAQSAHPVVWLVFGVILLSFASPLTADEKKPDGDPTRPETPDGAVQKPTEASEKARKAQISRMLATASQALKKPEVTKKSGPLFKTATAENTQIEILLKSRRLRVRVDKKIALDCAIACGRSTLQTASGRFRLVSREQSPANLDYGRFVDRKNRVLLQGVYSKLDALPDGAVFQALPPAYYFKLDESGPAIHSGYANGKASTDGSIVIPETVAKALYSKIPDGVRVHIKD